MRRTVILLLVLWLGLPGIMPAAESGAKGGSAAPQHGLAGERYAYALDFLMFKNLAEGQLQLTAEQGQGRYRAELVARTLGMASWVTSERTQRYVAVMEPDGAGRLRTVSYETSIRKRKWGQWNERQKRYRFDYQAGRVYQEKGEDGRFTPGVVFALPKEKPPVDILTGFYNLRAGVYGALTPGAHLKIPTFTTKGITDIDVQVLSGAARPQTTFFPANGTLLRVSIDPEIFNTGGGEIYAWLDDRGRPARGIVENVVGLGDVFGRLHEEGQLHEP